MDNSSIEIPRSDKDTVRREKKDINQSQMEIDKLLLSLKINRKYL